MRIIQIKATSKAVPYEPPYLFNVKETGSISMSQDEWSVPEDAENQVFTCALEPTLTEEGWVKTLAITHEGATLWEHTYETHTQRLDSRTNWCFITAGAQMHAQLSEICQLYKMPKDNDRRSRTQWINTLCGKTICFPRGIDDRSLVTMIEEGCIEYEGMKSIGIKRLEVDSKFCEITFG